MDNYDELILAHERYMAHEDLFTKWDNAAMVTQSILIASLSQILIYREKISGVIGENNAQIALIALPLVGLLLSLIWLLTDWRNFYYTIVRSEVIRDLETSLVEKHKKSRVHIYGVINKEFEAFHTLTSGAFGDSYKQHRKRWGRLFSVGGAIVSSLFLQHFSTRFRMFLIPSLFVLVWLGLLFISARLAS